MYVPVIQKLKKRNEVFIERTLDGEGSLVVKVGDNLKPYDSVGTYKAKSKSKKGLQILSGVWGLVEKIIDDRAALIKTQVIDLNFEVNTMVNYSGEFIVFPNPSRVLAPHYISKFAKNNAGKVIYIGDFINEELVTKASELNVAALIAASASLEAFTLAKQKNLGLGLISGLGEHVTPEYIYNYLMTVTNRFVFFHGDKGFLRIPVETKFSGSEIRVYPIKLIRKGMTVRIFAPEFVGAIGLVDSLRGSSIFVQVEGQKDIVEVSLPNVLGLE